MKQIIIILTLLVGVLTFSYSQTAPTCQPTITLACQEFFPGGPANFYINNFTLNGVDANSSCTVPPNINSVVFATSNLSKGSSYNFNVNTFTFFPSFGFGVSIWLDSNNDGDFVDSGEQLYTFSSGASINSTSGSITIPATAVSGLLHLRVIAQDINSVLTDPCGTYDYAEVEDYVVQISGPICTPTITSNSPACSGGAINLYCNIPGATYAWSGPNSFTSSQQNPVITSATTAATGVYTVTVSSAPGCTATASSTANVIVNAPTAITPIVTNSSPINLGDPVTLSASNLAPSGQAAIFVSASSQRISVNQDPPDDNYTIEFWFKTAGLNEGFLIMQQGSSNAGDRMVYLEGGVLKFRLFPFGGAVKNTGKILNDNLWHHLAITHESSGNVGTKVYIDNKLEFSEANSNTSYSGSDNILLGYTNETGGSPIYFSGEIDNFRLWNVVRTAAQISESSQLEVPSSSPGLVLHLPLNGNANALVGTNGILENTPTFANVNYYIYNWSGINAPAASTNTSQTTTGAASGIYLLNVTPAFCGTAISAATVVTIGSGCAPTLGSNSPVCSGNSLNLTSSTAASYSWSGPNSFTSTQQNPVRTNVSSLDAGIYTLISDNGAGCTATSFINVSITTLSVSASSNSPQCQGNTINLTASGGTNYSWTGPNSFSSTLQFPSILNFSAAQIGTYNVTVTSGSCSAIASTSISLSVAPSSPSLSPTTSVTVCYGETATFTATCPSGSTVNWRNVNGNNLGSGPTFTSFPITGNGSTISNFYNVFCIGDISGCTSPPTYFEVLLSEPSSLNLGSNSPLCKGSTLNLTNSVAATSYSWSGPNGFISNSQNPSKSNVNALDGGTYTLSAMVSGCLLSATTNVSVSELKINSNAPTCEGGSLNLFPEINAATISNYSWTGPNSFTSSSQYPVLNNILASQSGVYTLLATTSICITSATVNVIINPIASTTNNSPFCAQSNSLNLVTTIDNNIAGQSGSFNATNSQYITVPQSLPADNYTVEMKIKTTQANGGLFETGDGPGGSLGGDKFIFIEGGILKARMIPQAIPGLSSGVVINDNNWHHISITQKSFLNEGTKIYVDGILAASFPNSDGGGNYSQFQIGTEKNLAWQNSSYRTYYDGLIDNVKVWNVARTASQIMNDLNIENTISPDLIYHQKFSNNVTAAKGSNGSTPNGLSYAVSNIVYPYTYAWTGPNGFSSATQNPTIANTAANQSGIYTVTVNAGACQTVATSSVTIHALPTPTIGSNSPQCVGKTINLTSSGGVSYAWTGVNGFISNIQNPTISNVTTLATGTYMVTVTNANGCTATATTSIVINPNPVPNAGLGVEICSGKSTTIGSAIVAANTYLWSPTTGLSSSIISNPVANPTATATYVVTMTTTATGCTATDNVVVTVNPNPTPNAGLDVAICSEKSTIIGSATVAANTYLWSPSTGLSSSIISNPVANPTATATYVVTMTTTATGCTATDNVVVTVNPNPTPNAGSDVAICSGNSVTIGSATIAANTYLWTPSTGLSSSIISNPMANPTATATYVVTMTNTATGCTATDNVVVTVNPNPTPTTSGLTISSGSSATITATGCTTFRWYDQSIGGTLLFTGNPFVSPALTSNTSYYIACLETPCPESVRTSVLVTVSGGPPQPGNIVGGNTACQGRANLVYLVTAVAGATSYTWTYSGTGVTFVGGVSNTRTIALDFSYNATAGTISCISNNANGSSPASTMAISVSPAPPPPTTNGVTVENGESANLTATGCGFATKWYSESTGNTLVFTGISFNTPSLNLNKSYYVSCNNGTSCESARIPVNVNVNCSASLVINAPNYSTAENLSRQASVTTGLISATNKITNTARVNYQAKAILLDAGFVANPTSGGVFKAEIGGCN